MSCSFCSEIFDFNWFKIVGWNLSISSFRPGIGLNLQIPSAWIGPTGQRSELTEDGSQIICKYINLCISLRETYLSLHYKMVVVAMWNLADLSLRCLFPRWLLEMFLTCPLRRNQKANGNASPSKSNSFISWFNFILIL